MSFLTNMKQITILAITDTQISIRSVSSTDKKVISEHSVDIPTGVITRGVITDETRFSEALVSLRGQIGNTINKIVFSIPDPQCFVHTCILPVDISKDQIRIQIITNAKTIIPIQHTTMYIGYFEPTPISGTTNQSYTYIAVDGDIFNAYIRIFEMSNIESVGVTSTESTDQMLYVETSNFKQVEDKESHIKNKEMPSVQAPIAINNIQKKKIATYVFLSVAFVILGYIVYTYVVVPFI